MYIYLNIHTHTHTHTGYGRLLLLCGLDVQGPGAHALSDPGAPDGVRFGPLDPGGGALQQRLRCDCRPTPPRGW